MRVGLYIHSLYFPLALPPAIRVTRGSHPDRIPIARRGRLWRLACGWGIPRLRERQSDVPSLDKGFWSEKCVLGGRPGKTRVPSRVSRAGGRLFKERLDWETGKAFRSCQRVENAFCEGVEPPFLMKERARVARDSFCLTVMSCSFHFVISREEFTIPKIG